MSIGLIIVILVIAAIIFWANNTYMNIIPIRLVVNIVMILLLILWLCNLMGLVNFNTRV